MTNLDDPAYDWIEVTTERELLSEGRRTFVRGRAKLQVPPLEVTPDVVDAFERYGTDNYGAIVDTRAGLIAALKKLGLPVRE